MVGNTCPNVKKKKDIGFKHQRRRRRNVAIVTDGQRKMYKAKARMYWYKTQRLMIQREVQVRSIPVNTVNIKQH